jgi:hypothetical protein
MENATLFQQVAYIVGVSFIVFGIPSILTFALTEYICKRIWSK